MNDIFPEKINFDKNFVIKNVRPLDKAEKNDLTFLTLLNINLKQLKQMQDFVLQQTN